jgi:DNA-binding NarL/FixJ family response regulator
VIRDAIIELQRAGLSEPAIARQLGVAPTTVSYHLERLSGVSSRQEPKAPPEPAQSKAKTRDAVAQLLADGLSHVEIARRLLISKQTVSYHARRLGSTIDERVRATLRLVGGPALLRPGSQRPGLCQGLRLLVGQLV